MPRFFTLAEARDYLARVRPLVQQAVDSKAAFELAEQRAQEFVRRIMLLGGVVVDRSAFTAFRDEQVSSGERLKSAVEQIGEMGVLVKDLDMGLIDFPTMFRGDEVYLCWKLGEDDLAWWHGVHEGYAGRKEIDEDFLQNQFGRAAD